MTISVIIPAHNEADYIGPCLQRIIERATEDVQEIIVVDNASTDRTAEVVAQFNGVRLAREPAKGLTKARQRGLMEATGDIVAYVDADSLVTADWFPTIVREFQADKSLVGLSGPYVYYDTPAWQQWCIKWLYWNMLARFIYLFTKYMATGGNLAAKREALLKIGGFDTNIEFYGEDTDTARRLSEVGKMKFNWRFFMPTSGRRFAKEGTIKTGAVYVANYTAIMFSRKPISKTYKDIR